MAFTDRLANRGSISTAAFEIDNSCRFDNTNTTKPDSLYWDNSGNTATNEKIFTLSFWAKMTVGYNLESGSSNDMILVGSQESGGYGESINMTRNSAGDASLNYKLKWIEESVGHTNGTARQFRDSSAWYHLMFITDTTDGTAGDRQRFYVNGVRETFTGYNYTQNATPRCFNSGIHRIGSGGVNDGQANRAYQGYMAEMNFIDGQAKAATDFGETDDDSGIWKPKEYTGSYGTNGWRLDFADSSAMGNDVSGNNNDFSLTGIDATNQTTDTPTNNFCTLNSNVNFKYTTNGITQGNLEFGDNTGGGVGGAFGTIAVTAGKWYWECKLVQQTDHYVGVSAVDDGDNVYASSDPQDVNSTVNFAISAARYEYFNSGTKTYGSTDAFTDFHSTGDIIGIALNMDDNQITMYGNGTVQSGVAASSLYDAANKMVVPFHATINDTVQYNFGNPTFSISSSNADANGYGNFEYAVPSGYYALCTKNLAEFGG